MQNAVKILISFNFSDNEPTTMDESGIYVEKDPTSEKSQTDKPKMAKKEKRLSTSSSSTQTSESENAGMS